MIANADEQPCSTSGVIVKFRPTVEKAARDPLCCGSAHVVAGLLAGYKSGRQAPGACKTRIWGNPFSENVRVARQERGGRVLVSQELNIRRLPKVMQTDSVIVVG